MKNIIFIAAITFLTQNCFSQWSYEEVNNGFDEPYRIAYCGWNNGATLKLEDFDGDIIFYIAGGYFCDDYPNVDLVFVVNGENMKINIEGVKNKKSDAIFFTGDLEEDVFYDLFLKCSLLKIRINETNCKNETYVFNMSKSTSAFNFMKKK